MLRTQWRPSLSPLIFKPLFYKTRLLIRFAERGKLRPTISQVITEPRSELTLKIKSSYLSLIWEKCSIDSYLFLFGELSINLPSSVW